MHKVCVLQNIVIKIQLLSLCWRHGDESLYSLNDGRMRSQEPITRSLHLPYKPYETTLVRFVLFLETCREFLLRVHQSNDQSEQSYCLTSRAITEMLESVDSSPSENNMLSWEFWSFPGVKTVLKIKR